jgi:hypothetical protein
LEWIIVEVGVRKDGDRKVRESKEEDGSDECCVGGRVERD